VYSAPCLAQLLATIFDARRSLDKLEGFTSTLGDTFYQQEPINRFLTLDRKSWDVPRFQVVRRDEVLIPFMAGRTLEWTLTDTGLVDNKEEQA
jgi:dihydroorotase